eukprot:COSAG02_NODE_1681_length_11351_cov_20.077320_1_plen_41_part_00
MMPGDWICMDDCRLDASMAAAGAERARGVVRHRPASVTRA